ncbi:hypothetical protein cypCar_00011292 [Cyprinus carpio]|nr:hypothetical protein cypCar_00011292 [Cyprinus carpio]
MVVPGSLVAHRAGRCSDLRTQWWSWETLR